MKTEDYLALNFRDITALPDGIGPEVETESGVESQTARDLPPLDRRAFLKWLGCGIVVFVSVGELCGQEEGGRPRRGRGGGGGLPSDFNAFLHIGEDGRVTGFTGKIEMGQGPITSLAQMLAEELDAPFDSVDMVMGDTERCPWDMGTFGSMTTRFFGPALRAAAAEAKGVLLELAAEALQVPRDRLVAKAGEIFDASKTEHRVSYGQLAKGKKIERHLEAKAVLKAASDFTVVGRPQVRRDGHDKVTGKAQYAGDVRLPGMLYAKILRPPAHGAKLKTVDTEACQQVPGVHVIHEGDLVAVLHSLPDVAEAALAKVKAEFDTPAGKVDDHTIFDHLLATAPEPRVLATSGDLESGQKLSLQKIERTWLNSYVAHAAMETHTALAHVEGDRATVWASTQNPFGAQREIAEAIGLPAVQVRVITPFVGGGFGGKTHNAQAVEAARLSKLAGKPVQVAWTREEEFFYDTFRPAAIVKIKSGADGAGKILFWDYDVFFAGERGAQHFYDIPHHRTAAHGAGWVGGAGTHPFATGAWRAPGSNTNTFARESQIDVMAVALGIDPVEFRLKNLKDSRMVSVLKAAAEKFGWTPAKPPAKRGWGVACGVDAGTYVAAIAEVAVDARKGLVQVKRVVCAQDMGLVINPEGARIQMEGCITMGLGYALTEEVHFKGGEVLDTNFDTYEIPRFSWLPEIETVLLDSKENAPQGGGEPAIILMGALIANAIHDATGARLMQLPMTPERVKAALA
jgi:isoquinoline 1-oxidoreductase